MAELDATRTSLWESSVLFTKTDRVAPFSALLEEMNPILKDIPAVEANEKLSHRTAVQAYLPEVAAPSYNEGVEPTAGGYAPLEFELGHFESNMEVHERLARNLGKRTILRQQMRSHVSAMSNKMAKTLFFGNPANDESNEFMGLATFYSDGRANAGEQRRNIINAEGAGTDLTSIWIVNWSEDTIYSAYPKGSKKGLKHTDHGKIRITNAPAVNANTPTGRMMAYAQDFEWDCGLVVQDWRQAVRIANIKTSTGSNQVTKDPRKTGGSGPDLIDLIHQGLNMIYDHNWGRTTIYCNREVYSFLDRQETFATGNSTLKRGDLYGRGIDNITCQGFPIWRCDALNMDEGAVSF